MPPLLQINGTTARHDGCYMEVAVNRSAFAPIAARSRTPIPDQSVAVSQPGVTAAVNYSLPGTPIDRNGFDSR